MMPEVPTRDVMRRTMFNLDFIDERATKNGPYETTQLINSFLGALAHPWERHKPELDLITLRDAIRDGWPDVQKQRKSDYRPKNLGDLLRLMRNAFAHGHINFLPDRDGNIDAMQLWNIDRNTRTWGTMLTCDVLRRFLDKFVALAEELYTKETNSADQAA